ncbi:MAG: di-trans,poly-cis-decaprenylcistransferase [Deltaproteobacteria bacterium]|nr:di-trans,poly-cis-decaprenylcistransferase [Deltaproteobacteria bacterium]
MSLVDTLAPLVPARVRALVARTADATRDAAYDAYERRLARAMRGWRKPVHIGIVMDGNRRFAKNLRLAAVAEGHSAGADKLEEVLDWCEEADIDVVSVWGLSVDNLSRGPEELEGLMRLFEARLMDLVDSERIHRNRVQVRVVGRRELLPEHVRQAAERAERATAHHRRRTLNICLAYGGREEIVDALRAWHRAAVAAGADPAEAVARLEPDDLSPYLSTAPAPNPDLIIRTSGEVRLSGFLLWQSAQAEFYFCDTYWPAFRKIDFLRALRSYDQRHRRFGR